MIANGHGLPPAAEFKNFSGHAALQIHFYLTARPTRSRLAANRVLAAVPPTVSLIRHKIYTTNQFLQRESKQRSLRRYGFQYFLPLLVFSTASPATKA
jgi:hypothetical protein